MSRKNYVAIAEAISVSQDDSDVVNELALVMARNIADVMQADNPRFDRQRFLRACGVA